MNRIVFILASGMLLAGCGGSGSAGDGGGTNDAASDPASEAREVREVADGSTAALLKGDGKAACSYFTPAYRVTLLREAREDTSELAPKGDSCEALMVAGAAFLKGFAPSPDPQISDVKVAANTASFVLTITTSFGPSRSRNSLVKDGGEWKIDGDEDLDEEEEGASGPITDTPRLEVVRQWPKRWCEASIGMSRAEMRALMGPPTSEVPASDPSPQMSWDKAEYQFNAFFDIDDKVRQLDVNEIQLTTEEKRSIRCAFTRQAE